MGYDVPPAIYWGLRGLEPSKAVNGRFSRNAQNLRDRLLKQGKIEPQQIVCHHKCPIWRYFDHERYAECQEEDVEFLTREQHRKIHIDWSRRERRYKFLTNMFLLASRIYGIPIVYDWHLGRQAD